MSENSLVKLVRPVLLIRVPFRITVIFIIVFLKMVKSFIQREDPDVVDPKEACLIKPDTKNDTNMVLSYTGIQEKSGLSILLDNKTTGSNDMSKNNETSSSSSSKVDNIKQTSPSFILKDSLASFTKATTHNPSKSLPSKSLLLVMNPNHKDYVKKSDKKTTRKCLSCNGSSSDEKLNNAAILLYNCQKVSILNIQISSLYNIHVYIYIKLKHVRLRLHFKKYIFN